MLLACFRNWMPSVRRIAVDKKNSSLIIIGERKKGDVALIGGCVEETAERGKKQERRRNRSFFISWGRQWSIPREAVQNANSLHSPFKSEDNILGQLSVQNRGVMIPDPESDFHFFVLPDPDPVKCQIVTPIEVLWFRAWIWICLLVITNPDSDPV